MNHSLSDVLSFGIGFKLAIAARNINTADDGAALQAQQCNNRVSRVASSTNIGSFLPTEHTHTHTPPPPLPPACAILPTATLGKIIRWLADILSIFLSWLRVRLAGCLLIDVLTEFLFSFLPRKLCPGLPDCERARRGKCTGSERRAR